MYFAMKYVQRFCLFGVFNFKWDTAKPKITFSQQGKMYAPFSRKHRCPHMRFRVARNNQMRAA